MSLFEMRFPEIALAMHFQEEDPSKNLIQSKSLTESDLHGLEAVFLIGVEKIGDIAIYLDWLNQSTSHDLHLIETDLCLLSHWASQNTMDALICHPRFYVHGLWDKTAKQLAYQFADKYPSAQLKCFTGEREELQPVGKIFREELSRGLLISKASAARQFFWKELWDSFHTKKPLFSLSANALSLEGAFKGVPAIICGAGPSMQLLKEKIAPLASGALLIGAGTGVAVLDKLDLPIDIACFSDAGDAQYLKIAHFSNRKIPVVYTPHVFPYVIEACGGAAFLFPLAANHLEKEIWGSEGECANEWLENHPGAISITALAVALAYRAGCNPIILAGVDLSSVNGQRYSHFQDAAAMDQEAVFQLEREVLSAFIRSKSERVWMNISGGLPIDGCATSLDGVSFPPVDKESLWRKIDLQPMSFEKRWDELLESIDRFGKICQKHPSDAWYLLASDEIAYRALDVEHLDPEEVKKRICWVLG